MERFEWQAGLDFRLSATGVFLCKVKAGSGLLSGNSVETLTAGKGGDQPVQYHSCKKPMTCGIAGKED